jgi:hypothetical protein
MKNLRLFVIYVGVNQSNRVSPEQLSKVDCSFLVFAAGYLSGLSMTDVKHGPERRCLLPPTAKRAIELH